MACSKFVHKICSSFVHENRKGFVMSHKYLRCPVCGKLSKVANFQIHNIGGRHRFPDVMVQEISSEGRGKIRNEWYSEKLDSETRRELNRAFCEILSRVLSDIEEVIEIDEDEKIKVEMEEEVGKKEKKKGKWKDDEIFEVKGEVEGILKESDDEIVDIDDDEVFQGGDDESLDMEEEEAFRVF